MAYMRGHFYVYSDGSFVNFSHGGGHEAEEDCPLEANSATDTVSLPVPIAEEFVAMYWARMTPEQQDSAVRRAAEKYEGNFGADGVRGLLGMSTVSDEIAKAAARYAGEAEA